MTWTLITKGLSDSTASLVNKAPCRGEFLGGAFRVRVGGEKSAAIHAAKDSADVVFGERFEFDGVLVGKESRLVDVAGKLSILGGTYYATMSKDSSVSQKARVFKACKMIKVAGGRFVVNVPGEGP